MSCRGIEAFVEAHERLARLLARVREAHQSRTQPPTRDWVRDISPQGACSWKIALKYKVKQSKNGKFTSNYKASPIDFERKFPSVDKPLRIYISSPPKKKYIKIKISLSKRAFEKYKPQGLFSEFYGIRHVLDSFVSLICQKENLKEK